MSPHRDLDVLDAARKLAAEVIQFLDSTPRVLFRGQLRDAIEGIHGNIGEAFGRSTIADRNRVLVIARGEAEESMCHLGTNFDANRIHPRLYWRFHNRLVTIVKMLNRLMY